MSNHFEHESFEYYALKDADGNRLDVMHFPKVDMRGLFGMRVNVDDFDAMVDFLMNDQGYEFSHGPIETPTEKHGVLENPSKPDAMRYIVSSAKKG